jgi:hypothetical protein
VAIKRNVTATKKWYCENSRITTPRNNWGGLEAVVRGGYVSQSLRSCGDSDHYLLYSMGLGNDIVAFTSIITLMVYSVTGRTCLFAVSY